MTTKTLELTPVVYHYLQTHAVRLHPILDALYRETQAMPVGKMQIAPEQGAFLQVLIKLMRPHKCLEIGTFTGYSALAIALALPEKGILYACDINAEWTTIAQKYWQRAEVAHKINLRLAPAIETLQQFLADGQANSFDFIFIDADKEYYPDYYELAVELARPGGMIAVDNVLWYGRVADAADNSQSTRIIRQLNDRIYNDARVDMCMLPLGDGLTLAVKKDL